MTYKQIEKIATDFENKHPRSFFAINTKTGKILCSSTKMAKVATKAVIIRKKDETTNIQIRINPRNIPAIPFI